MNFQSSSSNNLHRLSSWISSSSLRSTLFIASSSILSPSSTATTISPGSSPILLILVSVLLQLIISNENANYIRCQIVTSSSLPYRHGLARYYQPQPPPPPSPSAPMTSTVNSYQVTSPLASTFTSYSISLPVQQRFYGPFQQSYYQPTKYQQPIQYLPRPQYCPETGRTVCSKVLPHYPTDEVFLIVKMARAKRFNISSEFIDESENDSEPYFDDHYDDYDDLGPYPFSESYQTNEQQYSQYSQQHSHGPYQMNRISRHHPTLVQHFHNLDWKFYRMPSIPITTNGPTNTGPNGNPNSNNIGQAQYGSIKSIFPSSSLGSTLLSPTNQYNSNGGHSRYKRQISRDDISIEPLCPSKTILLEPKAALNDRRQWKFVINLAERDRRLRQAIKVEVCMIPNSPCSNQISLPFGFISRCRQKYIKKKLISLDESGQSISSENFFAPSCCVCEVTRGNSPNLASAASSSPSSISSPLSSSASNSIETTKRKTTITTMSITNHVKPDNRNIRNDDKDPGEAAIKE